MKNIYDKFNYTEDKVDVATKYLSLVESKQELEAAFEFIGQKGEAVEFLYTSHKKQPEVPIGTLAKIISSNSIGVDAITVKIFQEVVEEFEHYRMTHPGVNIADIFVALNHEYKLQISLIGLDIEATQLMVSQLVMEFVELKGGTDDRPLQYHEV